MVVLEGEERFGIQNKINIYQSKILILQNFFVCGSLMTLSTSEVIAQWPLLVARNPMTDFYSAATMYGKRQKTKSHHIIQTQG